MNGCSDPYKPYDFLKDCRRTLKCIYVNNFNRPGLLRSVKNWKK